MSLKDFNRELLAKYLCKEVNKREKLAVEAWLDASHENREELEQSRRMLEKTDDFYRAKSFDPSAAWSQVHARITAPEITAIPHKKVTKETFSLFYKYAAILVVALLMASLGYYFGFRNQTREIYSEVISPEKQVINEYLLPDGSFVTLNSQSKLIFPKHFRGDFREVTVEGEAFFDVQPNPEKPFIIHAGKVLVQVVGTSFNVNAYPGSDKVEVIVAEGKVQVTNEDVEESASPEQGVLLLPGEKVTLFSKENRLEKSTNSDPNYLAWKTQDLIFDEVPLCDVIECLEKVYHVDIQVAEPEINNLMLKAHFDKKPIDFVMNVLRLTFNLDLSVENERFLLTSRKTQ